MKQLDQELSELKTTLLEMASCAETLVKKAVRAFVERDDAMARQVKEDDAAVDRLEVEVDEMCIALLTQAPLATDLRLIAVAMKISHDLERVADEATTISRRVLELNKHPELKIGLDVSGMASLALEMLKDALDAFVNQQSEKARALIPRDKEVDAFNKCFQGELSECMMQDPNTITRCLNLMVISKSLERIADHATNIAEEVVFLCEARDIRHTGKASGVSNL